MAGKRGGGHKTKSRRQVRFLLSKGSPLSGRQKSRLKGELHRGTVRVRKGRKRRK